MMSTVFELIACMRVVNALTAAIWNSDVPMTTRVGIPSR